METMATVNYRTLVTACGTEYNYARQGQTLSGSVDIRRDYESAPRRGHYFDRATLRFFGVRSFSTVAQGVTVECRSETPSPYRVTFWTTDSDGVPEAWFGCDHESRRDAVKCAKATRSLLTA